MFRKQLDLDNVGLHWKVLQIELLCIVEVYYGYIIHDYNPGRDSAG